MPAPFVPSVPGLAEASQIVGTLTDFANQVVTPNAATATNRSVFPIVANGTVGVTLTALGPTGASTVVQRWLNFVDATGRAGYIPVY